MPSESPPSDYFALLHQPRQPWLEPDELKRKYQEFTLTHHPDRQASSPSPQHSNTPSLRSDYFAEVTEAYRVSSHDNLRLRHLLELTGAALPQQETPADDLSDLFFEIGTLVQTTNRLLERSAKRRTP